MNRATQQTALKDQTSYFLEKARNLGYDAPLHTRVLFNLKGHTAGTCSRKGTLHTFRYNLDAADLDWDDMMNDTVPHEVAHAIVFWHYNAMRGVKTKPHGKEWQKVMRDLGCEPKREHNLPTTPSRIVKKRFVYQCDCGTRKLTAIKHNRNMKYLAKKGKPYYTCTTCHQRLRFLREEK